MLESGALKGAVNEGLGITDESLSAEIWGHAAGYRIAKLTEASFYMNPETFWPVFALIEGVLGKPTSVMDSGVGSDYKWERKIWDWMAEKERE